MSINIGADSSNSLSDLETLVQQKEELLGPLIDLGNDDEQTVITIDDDKNPPNQLVILKPTVAGVAINLANHSFICKGICFVTGVKKELAAYRPDLNSGNLAWGAKVSDAFRNKIRKIADDLGCNPDFLMAAMAFETGETFSPSKVNPVSGATGLIQFMPSTAQNLGTTADDLAKMSAEDQLDFVAEYFANQKGKLDTLEDVYMAILWPAAVGKADDYVLFAQPTKAYDQNKGLDLNDDGQVTKAEAAKKVKEKLDKGIKPENIG